MATKETGLSDTPRIDSGRLNEMAFSFKKTGALLAAIELDIFSVISKGIRRLEDIAAAIGTPGEAVERLLITCQALDLVGKKDQKYINAEDVEKYLVRGKSTYFGDYLVYQAKDEYDTWKNVASALRPPKELYYALKEDASAARRFTVAGYNASISLAFKVAKEFDFSRYKLFLDLGGGSGCYSIAAATLHPKLKALVFDFPNVLEVTKDFINQHNLSDRISTQPGDFMENDFPSGADLAAFITNLQSYNPEKKLILARKAYNALKPGGTLLIIDYMLLDDKSGPLDPAFMNLAQYSMRGSGGQVFTGAEYCECLTKVGFIDAKARWLLPHMLGLTQGNKP